MELVKTKIQSLGFTSAHFKLLTVAFIVIGGLTYIKSDLSLKALFVHADNESHIMTYEEARAEVLAELNYQPIETSSASDQEQLALLDRSEIDGKVLGEAIGIGEIPDADALMMPEITSQIKLVTAPQDTQEFRMRYQATTQNIETESDIISMLGDLNSTEKEVLTHAVNSWQQVIGRLASVPVPASLSKYHMSKLTYYSVLMNIGKVYAGQMNESQLPLLTKAMLSYSQKVDSLREQLNSQYGMSL